MRNVPTFLEIMFHWYGFSDVMDGLRDDNAFRSARSDKRTMSRLELDRDLLTNRTAV